MVPLSPEEQWARQVMAAELGAVVDQHDDQSQDSMYDLKITYPNGTIAAAEVLFAADGDSIELWKLVNPGGRLIYPQLDGGWMLSLGPTARHKRLSKELPDFLLDLEQRGVTEVPTRHRLSPDPDRDRAAGLGIIHASQSGTNFRGSVYFTIQQAAERTGGFISESDPAVADWVSEFLGSTETSNKRDKLERSGLDERHLLVILPTPPFSTAPFVVFGALWSSAGVAVPEANPSLPSQVTHVWLVSDSAEASGLRWSADVGWRRFAVSPPVTPEGS